MNAPVFSARALTLCETDALVDYWAGRTLVPRRDLQRAIGTAIDVLYATRDSGGNMHSSAAAVAVAVLTQARGEMLRETLDDSFLDGPPYE